MAAAYFLLLFLVLMLGICTLIPAIEMNGKFGAFCVGFGTMFLSLFLTIGYFCLAGIGAGSGHRDGYVQKFSDSGVLWTTKEGQLGLNQQGFNEWHFSVTDYKVIEQIEKLDTTKLVRLHYKKQLGVLPWRGETEYFIVGVETLKEPK